MEERQLFTVVFFVLKKRFAEMESEHTNGYRDNMSREGRTVVTRIKD